MDLELINHIIKKFKKELPDHIEDEVIRNIAVASYERMSAIGDNPSSLLTSQYEIETDDYWEGDIKLTSIGQYGINWVFDKESGELHTT